MLGAVGSLGPAGLLLIILLVIIWMVVLVWLGDRLLGHVARRTKWRMRDWRNWVASTFILIGLIHLANWLIDIAESLLGGEAVDLSPGWPSAFLIGSVAIAVPIAALRRRK